MITKKEFAEKYNELKEVCGKAMDVIDGLSDSLDELYADIEDNNPDDNQLEVISNLCENLECIKTEFEHAENEFYDDINEVI